MECVAKSVDRDERRVGQCERRTSVVVGAEARDDRVQSVVSPAHLHDHEHPIIERGATGRSTTECGGGGIRRCRDREAVLDVVA